MLPGLTLPASWRVLLGDVSSRVSPVVDVRVVRAAGHRLGRACGQAHGGAGMSSGAGMAAVVSFHACCRFFSAHAWDADRLGLALARLIVTRLLDADAPIEVVVDDTLFRRWGRRVFGAYWTHDGSAQDPNALGRGNRWIIVGIVVELPFRSHPVCLPVLFRLWRGKGTPSPVRLAGEMISVLRQQFPERTIHGVGDAAYHGKVLLVENTTFTTRLPVNAVLYAPAPPRTGKRGRARLKGQRLGIPAELATTADWRRVTVSRYGHRDTVESAETAALWYGAFGTQPGRVVLVRDPGSDKILALFTTDRRNGVERVVARYAHRWPIETAIAAGKQLRHRPSPQPPAPRGRTHRAVRVHRLQPRHHGERAARPPPRRPRRPTPRPALVPAPGRHRLRRHARQTPQNPSRSTNYRRCRSSARPQQIPRLRTGLRRSRRVTAKLKSFTNLQIVLAHSTGATLIGHPTCHDDQSFGEFDGWRGGAPGSNTRRRSQHGWCTPSRCLRGLSLSSCGGGCVVGRLAVNLFEELAGRRSAHRERGGGGHQRGDDAPQGEGEAVTDMVEQERSGKAGEDEADPFRRCDEVVPVERTRVGKTSAAKATAAVMWPMVKK